MGKRWASCKKHKGEKDRKMIREIRYERDRSTSTVIGEKKMNKIEERRWHSAREMP